MSTRSGQLFVDFAVTALVLCLGSALACAFFVQRVTLPVAAAHADQTFLAERALAEGAGLRLRSDQRAATPRVRGTVPLAPGECLSVIAATTGTVGLTRFTLRDQSETELGDDPPLGNGGFVRHLQWCSPGGGRFDFEVEAPVPPRVAILTGVPTAPLPRVTPRAELLPRLRLEASLARLERGRLGAPIAPALRLDAAGLALLAPSTPATRAALADALALPSVPARGALPIAPTPPSLRRFDVAEVPPVAPAPPGSSTADFALLDLTRRVAAVVDHGALGAPCVAVRFSTTDDALPIVWRSAVPGWATVALPVRDGVAVDRACPAAGLVVYAVPRGGPELLVSFEAPVAPAGITAVASIWRGEAQPHSLVARLDGACVTDPAACMELAHLARGGVPEAQRPDERRALGRACDLSLGEGCGRLGDLLLAAEPGAGVGRAARAALRRGCTLDDGTSCAVLGTRERLGDQGFAQDLPAAFTHLERACTLHVDAACADVATMRLLALAPDETASPTD